jgi:anti-anti-sigma factor
VFALANTDNVSADGDAQFIVEVPGELDVRGGERLWDELQDAFAGGQPVTLDMSRCEFLDSTGLTVILRAARELGRVNRRLSIFGLQGQPRRIFDLTRVLEHAGIQLLPA